ncbi:MAG: NADH-quinone oxidoreductase subunit NuoG [Thiohalomonadales bacterium]|nr:NADH-quinone oxidoreductase subunit NuoG [Thiohalomonadales bacterium]
MVNIEINGQQLQVPEGSMVIQAADEAGITIPRFCYHKKLSVAANCRMCLVEVEKVAKPLPACATPVTEGMRVFTRSPMALEAQKSVMEFLLINHPLDCPICDQGGECDLQDLAIGYGKDISRFGEKKRVVPDKNIGPLIATEMTRCIHCTRCVRFGQEIAGIMELGATGRGENMRIGTYVERTVNSEMSGNVIDLCPVGALTSKPYRYTSRPWENNHKPGIAPHDCLGSNINLDIRRNHVMRVVPRENEALNEVWLSDRDRFSYTGIYSEDRALRPMIKQGDAWKEVVWETALAYAVEGLKTVRDQKGADQIGALISPSATLEEHYLIQKLMRGIGSNNIDHRLRQQDFTDQDIAPLYPGLGLGVDELQDQDAILLIGSWLRKDQPIAAHRVRKAAMRGASIMAVNALDYEFTFPMSGNLISTPSQMPHNLAAIIKALINLTGKTAPAGLAELLENISVEDTHQQMAQHLLDAEKASVLLGNQAMNQAEFSTLRALANVLADMAGATFGYLSDGANTAGASLAGCLPHRAVAGETLGNPGKHAKSMIADGLGAYVLLGIEPEYDCANGGQALKSMSEADFVICLTPFVTDAMREYADVILPVGVFAETGGTYVNATGQWQSFQGAVQPLEESRPAWKVLRVLGNLFALDGFDYVSVDEVSNEVQKATSSVSASPSSEWQCPASLGEVNHNLIRVGYVPMYSIDPLVRRSKPLQATHDVITAAVYLNTTTASRQGIAANETVRVVQGTFQTQLPVVIDEGVPDQCIFIPSGVNGNQSLGDAYGSVEIQQA